MESCLQDAAGQMRRSPFQFSGIGGSSPQLFLALGFAVLDGPTLPIVAEGDAEPNDTYVQQLTAGAKAAVQVGPSHCPSQSDGRKLKSTQTAPTAILAAT